MQQSKTESDHPGRARSESLSTLQSMNDFCGYEHDAEGNRRFNRRTRHMNPADGGGNERDAVRNGEGCNRRENSLPALHDQQQCQYEQQMIDAAKNVFHTEQEICPGNLPGTGRTLDRELRFLRTNSLDLTGA